MEYDNVFYNFPGCGGEGRKMIGVGDMTSMSDINIGKINDNLKIRYQSQLVYVCKIVFLS